MMCKVVAAIGAQQQQQQEHRRAVRGRAFRVLKLDSNNRLHPAAAPAAPQPQHPHNALTNSARRSQEAACPAQCIQHHPRQPHPGQRPQRPPSQVSRFGHQCHAHFLRGQPGQGPPGERRAGRKVPCRAVPEPSGYLEQEPAAPREGYGWPAFRADYHGRPGMCWRMKEEKHT